MKTLTPLHFYLKWPIFFFLLLFASAINAQQETTENESIDFDCSAALEIKKFKKKNSVKKNKVVVGLPIKYEAKPKALGEYSWTLGDEQGGTTTAFWALDDNGQAPYESPMDDNGTAMIPNTELPMDNSDFGAAHGHLFLEAGGQQAEETIEVFFDKDATNPHDTAGVPNWFYYWYSHAQSSGFLDIEGIKLFDEDTGTYTSNPVSPGAFLLSYQDQGDWKWTPPIPGQTISLRFGNNMASLKHAKFFSHPLDSIPYCNGFRRSIKDYGNINFLINVGQSCGYEYHSKDYGPGPNPYNGGQPISNTLWTGIEGFYTLLIHELEHWEIFEEFWKDGYDTLLDCDLDYFPDAWEEGPIGVQYGFDPDTPDLYNENYNTNNLPNYGPSTHYQEEKCRRVEVSSINNTFNDFDWSFDPTGRFQGKKW